MSSILIVEDEERIRAFLTKGLRAAGFASTAVGTGREGLELAASGEFDLVVLDLGLPDVDGCTLLTMLRAVSDVPVIVATARDDEAETVRALDAGADDYVVKPFAAAHLDARVRAVLRRADTASPSAVLVVGDPLGTAAGLRQATGEAL